MLAATGETITERSGVINLGLEGIMLAGALAATLGATAWGPWSGVALRSRWPGWCWRRVFALLAIGARADQIITGTAITLAALGLTGTIYRQAYGMSGAGLTIPTLPAILDPRALRNPGAGSGVLRPAGADLPRLRRPSVGLVGAVSHSFGLGATGDRRGRPPWHAQPAFAPR